MGGKYFNFIYSQLLLMPLALFSSIVHNGHGAKRGNQISKNNAYLVFVPDRTAYQLLPIFLTLQYQGWKEAR